MSDATTTENPLAAPSALPYQLPPFDAMSDAVYRAAFEQGMREHRQEIERITRSEAVPSFENTVVALERSGQLLERVANVFFNLNAANTDREMQQLDSEIAPQLAAHEDSVLLDAALFARVEHLYRQRENLELDRESLQLLERYWTQFVRAGARLSDSDKTRLRALNQQLSSLTTQFKQNILKATQAAAVIVDSAAELDGLPAEQIGAAATAAEARSLGGKWLIALQNTTRQPALADLTNRPLRERIYRASIERSCAGEAGNRGIVASIVRLRAERAQLLGYPHHAAYQLQDESAGNAAAVEEILARITPAALARARQDAADMQALIDAETQAAHRPSFTLQPWDWPLYAQRLRKARFDFDQAEVRPYFELNRVLQDGVFHAAHALHGLEFRERKDLPVYHPDVRAFEVFEADGAPLALFLADYFARDNKQGGAWMNSFVRQSQLLGTRPVVCNNLNVPKPRQGEPALLTFDEVTTMFHEFGHALHGMLSNVRYPLLSGTSVPRDFVEFPSQYNEMWAREPAVLANYARHYRTGEPMPPALLGKVLAAQTFDQGYATTEYLAAAVIDQAWHRIAPGEAPVAAGVAAFEAEALRRGGLDYAPVPPRYYSDYFAHIFAGGYSAGYYAYLWSEVLARDTGQWFHSHGGLSRANGDYLRAKILSRGRTEDPQILFKEFYGRDPDIGPLLEYRGLTLPKADAAATVIAQPGNGARIAARN